jgi:hypothetical protein
MWRWRGRFWLGGVCATVGFAVGGCDGGDGLPRQAISGSVTLDGQPLPHGVISIYPPVRAVHGEMVVGGAIIENGHFSVPRALGLVPGKYKVAVHSAAAPREHHRTEEVPGNDDVVPKDSVPTRFNSKTILEIELSDHAIKEMKIDLSSE